mgnify:CR=1 FL=1
MYKKWQKSASKQPPKKSWSPEEMKIIGWCMNKNIKVSISPDWKDSLTRWQIEININGKTHIDPNRYGDDIVYDKFNKYYKYYYDKHNK